MCECWLETGVGISFTNDFQTLETGITHPQSSYTDTTHNAESGGFYNLKVELGN